jgi:hypothetical protein
MGGGVRLRSPTPDRGHLKETIKQAFPERSRMGTPLELIEVYGGWGIAYRRRCANGSLRQAQGTAAHPPQDRGHLKETIEQVFPERRLWEHYWNH